MANLRTTAPQAAVPTLTAPIGYAVAEAAKIKFGDMDVAEALNALMGHSGDVTDAEFQLEVRRRELGDELTSIQVGTENAFQNALAAQLTSDEQLEVVFTADVTYQGTTYRNRDVIHMPPRSNAIENRFNIGSSSIEQRVVYDTAPSAATVGKLAINRDTGDIFSTIAIPHPSTPNTFVPRAYSNAIDARYQGARDTTPAPADYDLGDWFVHVFDPQHPRVIRQLSSGKQWVETTYSQVGGGLTYLGAFPTGTVEEVAPHATANLEVYLDVDDHVLRQVTQFQAGRPGADTEYRAITVANKADIQDLIRRINSIVVSGGGRPFGRAAGNIAPEAAGDSTDRWPKEKLPEDTAYDADVKALITAGVDDTVIEAGPPFVHGDENARNLSINIRHPVNAYRTATLMSISVGGQTAVIVGYDHTVLHQDVIAEVSSSVLSNIWDQQDTIDDGMGGTTRVQRYPLGSYIPVDIRLLTGRGGDTVFLRTVDVLVVAAPVAPAARSNVLVAALDGSDAAGGLSVDLPLNYASYKTFTAALWDTSRDDIVFASMPTALLAAQRRSKRILFGNGVANWSVSTRVFSSTEDRILYAELHD